MSMIVGDLLTLIDCLDGLLCKFIDVHTLSSFTNGYLSILRYPFIFCSIRNITLIISTVKRRVLIFLFFSSARYYIVKKTRKNNKILNFIVLPCYNYLSYLYSSTSSKTGIDGAAPCLVTAIADAFDAISIDSLIVFPFKIPAIKYPV